MGKVGYRKIEWYDAPDNKPWALEETIALDCEYWEKLNNADAMFKSHMYLNSCKYSEKSGMYQLILNGIELHYGTLYEINAVVKSMIKLIERPDDYWLWMNKNGDENEKS